MPELKNIKQSTIAEETPEAKIKKLEEELDKVRQVAETAIKENQILRATIKAITQLI